MIIEDRTNTVTLDQLREKIKRLEALGTGAKPRAMSDIKSLPLDLTGEEVAALVSVITMTGALGLRHPLLSRVSGKIQRALIKDGIAAHTMEPEYVTLAEEILDDLDARDASALDTTGAKGAA